MPPGARLLLSLASGPWVRGLVADDGLDGRLVSARLVVAQEGAGSVWSGYEGQQALLAGVRTVQSSRDRRALRRLEVWLRQHLGSPARESGIMVLCRLYP